MTDPQLARAIRAIAEQLAALQGNVRMLQQGQTHSQLGRSSIDDGTLTVVAGGTIRQTIGVQPDGTVTTVDQNAPAPPVPSTPTVTPAPGGLTVAWDGTFSGGATTPLDFTDVEVHLSTTPGFTPSVSTLHAVLLKAGQITIQPLSSSTTYYVGLVAVNTSSNKSTVSTESSGVPQGTLTSPVTATEIGNIGVLNANPYFTGGDGTGWTSGGELSGPGIVIANPSSVPPFMNTQPSTSKTVGGSAVSRLVRAPVQQQPAPPSGAPFVVSLAGSGSIGTPGTVSVVTTQPAGSPYAYALQFVSNTLGGGTAQEAGPPAFPVVPGQQYLVTGLFYTPGTLVSLGLSFFLNGVWTTDVAGATPVTPNTWTQVTTVVTAPSGSNSAGPVFSTPGQGSQYTMYGQAVLVLPQVPGALIQAGTITATQIAAGTVVAGIINGTVVEAATLIVDASSVYKGAFFYDPLAGAGNLIGSLASQAGTDPYGNNYSQGFSLYQTQNGITASIELSFSDFISPIPALQPFINLTTGYVDESLGFQIFNTYTGTGPTYNAIGHLVGPAAQGDQSQVVLEFWSSQQNGAAYALGVFNYFPNPGFDKSGGIGTTIATWDYTGFNLTGAVSAVQPGFGTPSLPAVAEVWHSVSAASGWTTSGQSPAMSYKLMADNTVAIEGSIKFSSGAPATGATMFTLPPAYRPITGKFYLTPTFGGVFLISIGTNGAVTISNWAGFLLSSTSAPSVYISYRYPLDL